jgi:hypothetical protein
MDLTDQQVSFCDVFSLQTLYKIMVGKTAKQRPSGIPTHRLKDDIKMQLREMVCEGVVWICLSQDTVQ